MTTIAYHNGMLAADKRSTTGGWVGPYIVEKIRWLDDNLGVLAYVGPISGLTEAVDRIRKDRCLPDKFHQDDLTVIHFNLLDQVITVWEPHQRYFHADPKCAYAWGSGSVPALAAMYAGASPEQAVEIASRIDPYTGGGSMFVRLW